MTAGPTRTIGIVVFPDAEELDVVGPQEVLASWTRLWPQDGYKLVLIAPDESVVRCARGLRIVPDHSFTNAPALDILVHAGGPGTRRLLTDAAHLEWVRARAATAKVLASVCTGSLVLAAAGLLRGRIATTHWRSISVLAEIDPSIDIRPHQLVVDDGDVITGAGVTTGIDLALHLVRRLASTARSEELRHGLQYDPASAANLYGRDVAPANSESTIATAVTFPRQERGSAKC